MITPIFFCIAVFTLAARESSGNRLRMSAIVFRNGKSSPYATNSIISPNAWPEGPNVLTNQGRNDSEALGRWYKERTTRLLGNPQSVWVGSTNRNRSSESANSFIRGAFSDQNSIPVERSEEIFNFQPCGRSDTIQRSILQSQPVMDIMNLNEELFNELRSNDAIGFNVDQFNLWEIGDILRSMKEDDKPLPGWASPHIFSQIDVVLTQIWTLQFTNPEVVQLGVGLINSRILEQFKKVACGCSSCQGTTMKTVQIFSGHHNTILQVLAGLQIDVANVTYQLPSSALVLELIEDDYNDFYVRFIYKSGPRDNGVVVRPRFCSGYIDDKGCPFDAFKQHIKHFTLTSAQRAQRCSAEIS